jgi:hypothetical protein
MLFVESLSTDERPKDQFTNGSCLSLSLKTSIF